jgi:superfamily II DNA/RNA helicase
MDHILDNTLPLQHLEFLVADEADRLLNQDFNDWLPLLLDALKEVEEARRMELIGQNCSFTRSHKIVRFFPRHRTLLIRLTDAEIALLCNPVS